jgi:integrase
MPNPYEYTKYGKKAYLIRCIRPDNGKRTTVRLGAVNKTQAKELGLKVGLLLNTIKFGLNLAPELHHWLSQLDDKTYGKLVQGGLVLARKATVSQELEKFVTDYCDEQVRAGVWKPRTQEIRKQCKRDLVSYFGKDKKLTAITPGDADDWFLWLQKKSPEGRGLSRVTVAKRLKDARQFFAYAVRKALVPSNPFDGIRIPSQDNPERSVEIPVKTFLAVLEKIDDPEIRLIVALGRYGGLRIPSEPSKLRWGDIDFDKRTMRIHSPKTERHSNAIRTCPLFPELILFLETLRPESPAANAYVLVNHRGDSGHYRRQFEAAIKAAGLKPWPRLFHNLRANAFTDLCDRNSMSQVCKWLGNSIRMGEKHYLLIRQHEYQQDRPQGPSSEVPESREGGNFVNDESGTDSGTVRSGQERSGGVKPTQKPRKTRGNQ